MVIFPGFLLLFEDFCGMVGVLQKGGVFAVGETLQQGGLEGGSSCRLLGRAVGTVSPEEALFGQGMVGILL